MAGDAAKDGMWFIYALGAAILSAVSYVASERAIKRGRMRPAVFFTLFASLGAIGACLVLAVTGRLESLPREVQGMGSDWPWLAAAVVGASLGTALLYFAIGARNATLASLIEISYPLFVVLFAWLFFRETHLNAATAIGGILIMAGVALVLAADRS